MNHAPFPHRLVPSGRQIRHDPDLGHAFLPEVHTRVPHEHGAYFTVTNREGFREDHDLSSPPPGFRVLCYGDSYAAGDGVDNGERFTSLVAKRLGVTVSNVAVPGHGPDQNLLQLEQGVLPRPDLILWCIAVHTIERIRATNRITIDRDGHMWRVDRPHFVLTATGELELKGVPVPEQGEQLEEVSLPQLHGAQRTRLANFTARVRSGLVTRLGRWLKPPPDPDYGDRESEPMRLLTAIIQRFHRAAAGVPVAIVPLPTSRYVAEPHEPVFQQRFAELATPGAGLHVLDVVQPLQRAEPARRATMHYRLDGHFTRAGHIAVADALAEQLRDHALVPTPAAVTTRQSGSAPDPEPRPASQLTLIAGWDADNSFAEVRAPGGQVAAPRRLEAEFVTARTRPGTLPLSAIHAVLEQARVAGPELQHIELQAPGHLSDLLDSSLAESQRFTLAMGHVRWRLAAEADLRTFLGYRGAVEATVATDSEPDSTSQNPAADDSINDFSNDDDDDELRWLRSRLSRALAASAPPVLERRISQLAHEWEIVTRTARHDVLPTTAPLRRGRMAQRLRQEPR